MGDKSDIFFGEDPYQIFRRWLEEAANKEINDPDAIALSTVDPEGMPNVRMVLLRQIEDESFVFYTNYGSVKSKEIFSSQLAAFVWHSKSLRRQIRVRGQVEKEDGAMADLYYESRSLKSRVGAWASIQSQPLESRSHLMQQVQYFENKYGPKIYEYILEEREKYESKVLIGDSTNADISKELTEYHKLYNDVSGADQLNEIKTNLDALEEDVRNMVNETETNKRKMEYRHEVSEQVVSQSTKINYIYYFILACIFIFLISKNALRIKEHILLYSFVLIFPFLYRYIFIGLVYVYNIMIQTMNAQGPKNAFLDNTVNLKFLDDYDV